ncbi:S8 family serine peptidase [Bacillus sp. RD4P76]|uniref:S8 family serine peptidase n=2 Tax=Bacillus suaedaesalsae TaxID=2810349 RepID=A0ABS2DL26_9BACI|nr:S8 family serine peptidase [Bacillus suaedaesalsae]MBM6619184.1 S8 family serine peptidase [Bacillus suaedaesalsae]
MVATFFSVIPTSNAEIQVGEVKVDPDLNGLLETALDPIEIIVTFKGDGAPSSTQLKLLEDLGITKGVTFENLPIAGAVATVSQIKELAKNPEVYSIYDNEKITYENETGTELTGVDQVRKSDTFRNLNGGTPVSGKGVGVVVNDSGVDGTHPDLQFGEHVVQNVMASINLHALDSMLPITYLENVPNTDSTGGHGTHVAGIVGGTGEMSGGKYEGVAPGADIIGYGSGAAVAIIDTIGAFDYALTHQSEYNIRVITNSWGSTSDVGKDFDPFDPINIATKKLYDRGIVTVFSAGNSGPGEATITGNYKKAPWVITVAAGTKQGKLTDFSSRGVAEKGGEVIVDGETFKWEDRPTITAPGEGIISTRVVAPVSSLGITDDVNTIDPAHLPYYTTMSGTSMAAPHVAGMVALILEANPLLSPKEVKDIIQNTATNMSGYEVWEVGAGYANAYAAVDAAFTSRNYGTTVNMNQTFNAKVESGTNRTPFTIDYSPLNLTGNTYEFEVGEGVTEVTARMNATGLLGQTGNPVNLVLVAPDGTETSSGVSVLFPLYTDRTAQVTSPMAGKWQVKLEGVNGLALPETIKGEVSLKKAGAFTGLNDIAGHPAEDAIKAAVNERLVDSFADGNFRPNDTLTRIDFAKYLTMGAGVRQYLPLSGVSSFTDVKGTDVAFAEAVAAKGAALRDTGYKGKGVILPTADGKFSPKQSVSRAELAYSLVQNLGLHQEAEARNGDNLTVLYNGQRVAISDASQVPAHLRGYVQLALDLNILNAYFHVTQGPYDLVPTVTATFKPTNTVTRADYAVAITRYHAAY